MTRSKDTLNLNVSNYYYYYYYRNEKSTFGLTYVVKTQKPAYAAYPSTLPHWAWDGENGATLPYAAPAHGFSYAAETQMLLELNILLHVNKTRTNTYWPEKTVLNSLLCKQSNPSSPLNPKLNQ